MAIPEKPIAFSGLSDLDTKATVIGLNGTTTGITKPLTSVLFSRECLEAILGTSCTGIRFYLVADTIDAKLCPTLMAVGEDSSENLVGPNAYVSTKPCPPDCPKKDERLTIDKSLTTTSAL